MRSMTHGITTRPLTGLINGIISFGREKSLESGLCRGLQLLFITLYCSSVSSQDYTFRNFRTDEGLAQPYVYSIIQDGRGYLWIGTGNGLSRYNGLVFETFTISDSLADNFITSGIIDGKYVWFGHMNGSLSCFDGKKFSPYRLGLERGSPITHFAKSPNGAIWLSTYSDGFMRIGKGNRIIRQDSLKDRTSIITFEFLSDRELLAGTDRGLILYKLNESLEIEETIPVEEIPRVRVTCIRRMRGSPGFYIATENDGIYSLYTENNLFRVSSITEGNSSEFTGIQDLIEDSRSGIWIGSFGKGLFRTGITSAGKLFKINSLNTASGFPADNVKTVFEDFEGNIWSGNYGNGLTQIIPKAFSSLEFNVNLYGEIHCICKTDQYLWAGTEKGLVRIDTLSGTAVRIIGGENGFTGGIITALCSVDRKEIWIGTDKNGLYRMQIGNGKIVKFPVGEDALENSITSIAGRGDQIYAGTKKGLCVINVLSTKIKWFTINQGGLPHNFVNSLFIDSKGRLWVTTHSNALSCIEDGKIIRKSVNTGTGVLMMGQITEDSDSRIWVGSAGNGIFLIGPDTITNITVKEGLFSNYCYSVISDNRKNIWVGHKGGLSRVRTDDFYVKPYKNIDGIQENYQFLASVSSGDRNGRIWFSADKGLITYDPAMDVSALKPPVLEVTSIRINNELAEYREKVVLSPGIYKIQIDYLAICLKEPELVSYQYRLDGYDQWSEVTHSTRITYNHLSEGNYTFILKASSGDGVVTDKPLMMRISIGKPIWKKWWFSTVSLSLLFILALLYSRRREQKFLEEKRILEEKVRERTLQIQNQKNEIELQSDLIREKNSNILASIKYASRIQNALLTPSELIDKLLPDSFILNMPKDIVSGDFYWLAKKDGKIIFVVADSTGHGVPGAFMSLLGITLLNDIVNIQGITSSDNIVTKLRDGVINSMQQGRKEVTTSDGMDLSLCVLDRRRRKIQFTGAVNDMVFIRNGKMETVKADRLSVCLMPKHPGSFTSQEIEYRKGDLFYLFTDGYQDQFGGDFDKKFLRQHFFVTLMEIHEKPMILQKEILEIKLRDWIGGNVQTDDVTVMGIRF